MIKHFFRTTPDGWSMKLLGLPHVLLMAFALISAIAVWKSQETLRKNDLLRKPLITTILVLVTILYTWYITSGYNDIREGLPLYSCRMAMFAAIAALLTKNRFAQNIACYWGLTGGVIAFLLPSMDPFSWLHFTNISFVLGHYALLLTVLYIICVDGYRVNISTAKTMIIITTIFNIFNAGINALIGSNYNFLRIFPFGELPFAENGTLAYTLVAIVIYNAIILAVHVGLKMLCVRAGQEDENLSHKTAH